MDSVLLMKYFIIRTLFMKRCVPVDIVTRVIVFIGDKKIISLTYKKRGTF